MGAQSCPGEGYLAPTPQRLSSRGLIKQHKYPGWSRVGLGATLQSQAWWGCHLPTVEQGEAPGPSSEHFLAQSTGSLHKALWGAALPNHSRPNTPPWVAQLTPSPEALGSTFSSGTSTPSMTIMPVAEARSENLPSIRGAERPRMPLSSRKPRMHLSSHRAHTTNRSATGELVILGAGQAGERPPPPPWSPTHPGCLLTRSWPR